MEKIWKLLENVMRLVIFRLLHLKMEEDTWGKLCQFVKFGLVGVSNTLISYVIYALLVAMNVHYLAASIAGFIISVVNAYYWNNKYVFKAGEGKQQSSCSVFLKTFTSYAGTGLVLNNILLVLWVDILGLHEMLGPAINLFITIPLNFILNKFWTYKDKR